MPRVGAGKPVRVTVKATHAAHSKRRVVRARDRGRLVHGESEILHRITSDAVTRGEGERVGATGPRPGCAGKRPRAVAVIGKGDAARQRAAAHDGRGRETGRGDAKIAGRPDDKGCVVGARDGGRLRRLRDGDVRGHHLVIDRGGGTSRARHRSREGGIARPARQRAAGRVHRAAHGREADRRSVRHGEAGLVVRVSRDRRR